MERSREDARQVLERVRQGEGLANAAAAAGLEVRDAGPFTRVDFVQGLGSQNAAIGAAFGTPPGEVSDVVQTANNTFLIEVVDRVPADSTAWRAQIDQQREATLQQLRAQRLDVWLEALRASADIRDRRDEVLRQPGDDEPLPPMMPMGFWGASSSPDRTKGPAVHWTAGPSSFPLPPLPLVRAARSARRVGRSRRLRRRLRRGFRRRLRRSRRRSRLAA